MNWGASLCHWGSESFLSWSSRPRVWSSWRWDLAGSVDPRRPVLRTDSRRSPIVDRHHPHRSCSAIIMEESTWGEIVLSWRAVGEIVLALASAMLVISRGTLLTGVLIRRLLRNVDLAHANTFRFWEHHSMSFAINDSVIIYNQSIPSITSSPSKGKHIRFTLNRLPSTSIKHPTQVELVETCPDVGFETINLHPRSRVDNPSFFTHSWDMKECKAPESNNTNTRLPNNKQKSSIRLPDWVASVLVKAKTRPTALGLSDEDGGSQA